MQSRGNVQIHTHEMKTRLVVDSNTGGGVVSECSLFFCATIRLVGQRRADTLLYVSNGAYGFQWC